MIMGLIKSNSDRSYEPTKDATHNIFMIVLVILLLIFFAKEQEQELEDGQD